MTIGNIEVLTEHNFNSTQFHLTALSKLEF